MATYASQIFNGAFGVKVSTADCESAGESSSLSLHPNLCAASVNEAQQALTLSSDGSSPSRRTKF